MQLLDLEEEVPVSEGCCVDWLWRPAVSLMSFCKVLHFQRLRVLIVAFSFELSDQLFWHALKLGSKICNLGLEVVLNKASGPLIAIAALVINFVAHKR